MNTPIESKTRLIVGDIGSTKGAWSGQKADGTMSFLLTDGYNPHNHPEELLKSILRRVASHFGDSENLIYYGTGITDEVVSGMIRDLILAEIMVKHSEVHSDLTGAARACLADRSGIVAILGTGSNACRYNGTNIEPGTPSLGYPLGDEGSGWRIGAALIRGFYYESMPQSLRKMFGELLPDTRRELLAYLKQSPQPNRYLASFATFAGEHKKHPWVTETVYNCLDAFVTTHLLPLRPLEPVCFVGGIAGSFTEILEQILIRKGLEMGAIIADPLEALIKYHTDS